VSDQDELPLGKPGFDLRPDQLARLDASLKGTGALARINSEERVALSKCDEVLRKFADCGLDCLREDGSASVEDAIEWFDIVDPSGNPKFDHDGDMRERLERAFAAGGMAMSPET
jgi:hypothetical protein